MDIFSYQIPSNYSSSEIHPLLVAFHQWGGNQTSTYSTNFDEEAESRNWIFLSPFGGVTINFAVPFNDDESDKTEGFQFRLGSL